MEMDTDDPFEGMAGMQASNDDSMEVDMADGASEHHHVETSADRQQYLQAKQIPGQDVNDWAGLPELPNCQLGAVQTVANIYRSSFTILLQAWQCHRASCIPEKLQRATPYSLGLTVRLAELAMQTRGHKEEVHAILTTICQERFAYVMETHPEYHPAHIVSNGMQRTMLHKRYTEHRIKEYISGLTIADVEEAKILCKGRFRSRDLQTASQREDRASRAAKRMNRYDFGSAVNEVETQQPDTILETAVGAGLAQVVGRKKQKLQRSQRPHSEPGKQPELKKAWKRRARDEVLREGSGRQAERKDVGDETGGVANGDQDTARPKAPPNSPRERNYARNSPASKERKKAKRRAKTVDTFVSRIFDGISMEESDLTRRHDRPPAHVQGIPRFLRQGSPKTDNDTVLPLERSMMHSSTLSFRPKATSPLFDDEAL